MSTFTGREQQRTVLPRETEGQTQERSRGGETDRVEMREAALISNKCKDVTLVKTVLSLTDFSHVPLRVKKCIPLITTVSLCCFKLQ